MKINVFDLTDKLEIELSIKLVEYLKRKNAIDDGMYGYVINKLVKKE